MTNLYEAQILEVKKGNFFDHPGIVTFERGILLIIHNSPNGGVIKSTYEEFADGEVVRISNRYETRLPSAVVVQRARQKLGTPWTPWYNCQHFVSEVFEQRPRSHDWQLIIGTAVIVALLCLAAKRT